MDIKTCPTCSIELTTENSYRRHQGKPRCKKCFSARRVLEFIKRKIWAIGLMGGKCVDCQRVYPYQVFSFHHLNPSEKDHDWRTLRKQSDETVKRELAKCVLLCMNCHAIRHIDHSKDPIKIMEAPEKKPNDPKHGLASTYNHHKCRCDDCIEAHKLKQIAYRQAKRNGRGGGARTHD